MKLEQIAGKLKKLSVVKAQPPTSQDNEGIIKANSSKKMWMKYPEGSRLFAAGSYRFDEAMTFL